MSEFLRAAELDVTKGVNFAVPSVYLGAGNNYPQNMQLYRGELKKRDGRTVVGTVSLGAQKILHLGLLEMTTGIQRLIRHTKKNSQKYDAGTGLWTDISGVDLTGSDNDFFDSTIVTESDLYLFCNNLIDAIRKYNDSGVTVPLGGNPPKCKTMDYITPYVLIGNLLDSGNSFPQKVQWCDTGQPEVWTGGNSGSALLSDEPSAIKKIKKLLDYAMVYKEKSIYRGRKVSTSAIFDFGGPFQIGKGLAAPRAIADDGAAHYYMGPFDFHMNNSVRVVDIGEPVREYIFNRLNRSRIDTCHALHVEQYKEVWFFVTVAGNDHPTEVWKFNYKTGFWYYDTVVNCLTSALYKQTVDLTWDTDPGVWDDEITFWDDQQGLSESPLPMFGYSDGFVERLNTNVVDDRGVAVMAQIDSKDYSGITHKGIEFDTRWMQFDVWARGYGNIKLYYSIDYGANWIFVKTKPVTPLTEKVTFWFDKVAPHIRFRMQSGAKGEYMSIRGFTPYYKDEPEITR